jgi:uncharacterized membrane protein
MALTLMFHALAAVIWVGGMFFAYVVLRPTVGTLGPAMRLPLWDRVLARYFPWVWSSIASLLVTGFTMVFFTFGGLTALRVHIRAMMMIGMLMSALYLWLYFGPWRRFRQAVKKEDWNTAERRLAQIRRLVGLNLALGMINVVVGASGRYIL